MRGVSHWFTAAETMHELKEVVSRALLPLQLSFGLFLIMKTTPLWAVIHCTIAFLLDCCHFPHTDYKHLKGFKGRVFKKVISHATTAGNVSKVKNSKNSKKEGKSDDNNRVSVVYLGKKFVLERKDENMMLMEDGPAYCVTDKMWKTIKYIEKVAPETVFVKDHKEIWEEVVTGDIMKFEEVLDSVILDNRAVIRLDQDYFLPVNLLLSEDKLMTILNFVGVFLRTQEHINWFIPASLSFTAAVVGFSTELRLYIDGFINKILCRSVHLLCDLMPLTTRRRVYFWGNWVGNLKPSNDLQSKIVSGDVSLLVAAGAKANPRHETFFHRGKLGALLSEDAVAQIQSLLNFESLSKCGPFLFKCDSKCNSRRDDSIYIEWVYKNGSDKMCSLKAGRVASPESLIAHYISIKCDDNSDCRRDGDIELFKFNFFFGSEADNDSLLADDKDTASVDVECSAEKAIKLLVFACYMAKYKSGSLKSYNRNTNTVYVRRFVESINAYVRSGYPPLYRQHMEDVIVL